MSQTREEYDQMPVEKLYEIARKRGVRNDDTMDKEELIEMIVNYDEKENEGESPEDNDFSAKPSTP